MRDRDGYGVSAAVISQVLDGRGVRTHRRKPYA